MAAIIAQMNRAKWERKKNKKKHIATNKSGLFIPPFDDGPFVPEKHNKYLRNHKKYLQKIRIQKKVRHHIRLSIANRYGYDSLRINIGDVDEEEEDLNSEEIEIECQKKEHLYPKMITGVVGVLSWTIVVAIFIFLLLRAMQLRSGND
ncbi:uncharacterized protein [Lepeophtheirus salmonis]|uniref:Uncharacterized protein n=1 Tax=Lepeophtheirus salmonis TaxID=72036 RepID=A0A0K2U7T1_LEPSM|nr:uncharacterized protein LOC121132585 [Lepeophtheirus salmonis]